MDTRDNAFFFFLAFGRFIEYSDMSIVLVQRCILRSFLCENDDDDIPLSPHMSHSGPSKTPHPIVSVRTFNIIYQLEPVPVPKRMRN